MGLYFFLGVIIYLLILVTLMVWFLKYHGDNDRNNPHSTKDLGNNSGEEANESGTKPNQISMDSMQSGGQSVSEKSEVLPEYCSQPHNLKIL